MLVGLTPFGTRPTFDSFRLVDRGQDGRRIEGRRRAAHFGRHALADVEVVDSGRLDADQDFAVGGRIGDFLRLEHLGPAGLMDDESKEMSFPAQYMFKDVPPDELNRLARPGQHFGSNLCF